jgi:DNA-binding beta-propeller fold protein YncE
VNRNSNPMSCGVFGVCALAFFCTAVVVHAGQAPAGAESADIAVSHRDRVYAAEQFSNTVSVTDPADNTLLGVIRLGDTQPTNFTPLYRGQVLVHGLGFSWDHKTIAAVAIGSNAVNFIDTATNAVKHVTYVGRSPHEAFFTPDDREVWVTVRGEDYIAVIDARTFEETRRIRVPNGPGMQIFSPDGKYAYICSSFTPETVVIELATHAIVGHVAQASAFCPDIAVTPDAKQVWFTLKDVGKVQVFSAVPPFAMLKTLDTGPITNHVNFARTQQGQLAYVTIGGLDLVRVFRTTDYAEVATIHVGSLPHGIWPSGDGTRMYVGLENDDQLIAIDTEKQAVVASVPIGQAAQAVVYVPNAVAEGDGRANLQPLGKAGEVAHIQLVAQASAAVIASKSATSVSLFDQGLQQIVQAAVTGLAPKSPYFLALTQARDGSGKRDPIASFTTNPAGAAIVNAAGQVRQWTNAPDANDRRYLAIIAGTPDAPGAVMQLQVE